MYKYKLLKSSDKPLYELLYNAVKEDILKGKLKSGNKLPSKRDMAISNNVSLTTVMNAYNQLTIEGYIISEERKGYFIADIKAIPTLPDTVSNILPMYVEDEWFADFCSNNTLYQYFPFTNWKKVLREVLSEHELNLIKHGNPFGNRELKNEISEYLYRNRGISVSPELIVIGAGIEFLYNRLITLLPHNAVYAVENPSYRKIPMLYNSFHLNWKSIDMDNDGVDMESLKKSGSDILHVSPEHHYPLGTLTTMKRRQELLLWANENKNRYIIEDDYDCEFRYDLKSIPALKGIDAFGNIIYMNTFSKTLSPAIRISYMVLPEQLMKKYIEKTYFFTNSTSNLEQLALTKFMKKGYFERHINRIKKFYRLEGETLRTILLNNKNIPITKLSDTHNGTHILVTLDTDIPDYVIKEKIAKKSVHVDFLSSFCSKPDKKYDHTLILNFSNLDKETQKEAIRRIGEAFT